MARPKQSGARKASKYRAKPIENERAFDRSLSRANKTYNTYEDTMDGDEDACASPASPSPLLRWLDSDN